MSSGARIVMWFFIAGVISAIVSGELIFLFLMSFYGGNPADAAAYSNAPMIGAGIGAGVFSILMLVYPISKKASRSLEWDDFK